MSKHSHDDFYDVPIENHEDSKALNVKKQERQSNRKENISNKYHTSDLSLLKDYVVIHMENGYKEVNNARSFSRTPSDEDDSVSDDTDEESDIVEDRQEACGDEEEGENEREITARLYVSIQRLDDNHIGVQVENTSYDNRQGTGYDEADETTDSDDPMDDNGNTYESEESDLDNDCTGEDDNSESEGNFESNDNPPLEGQMSPAAQASLTRLSTLNSSLYKTDGEDLSDVALTRSFATRHRQKMVDAGAKTIGELYVGLKRRRAQEITNAENGGTESPHIIQKRNKENDKLKKKPQKLPKSTIPFLEKTDDRTRQKQVAYDTERSRTSPLSGQTSGIDLAPEVSGDMGNVQTRVSMAPSEESLTPESLTRLCHTNTGDRSTGENKSRHSQPISDLDSRTGCISGRKNPQAKPKAANREASKSRIPLPTYNRTAHIPPIVQTRNHPQNHMTDQSSNSVNNPVSYSRDGLQRHVTNVVHVANLKDIVTMGTCCTLEKKPPIPHQMKSVACYHDGKLDVSILGDSEIPNRQGKDSLNLQFTLLPQIKGDKKEEKNEKHTILPPLNHIPLSVQTNNCQSVDLKKDKSARAKPSGKKQKRKLNNRTRNIKQLPPLKKVNMNVDFITKSYNNKWMPSKSLMEHKIRRDKIVKGNRPVDIDVVNHRAQYPPFNTYTDPEASARFQKIWCSL